MSNSVAIFTRRSAAGFLNRRKLSYSLLLPGLGLNVTYRLSLALALLGWLVLWSAQSLVAMPSRTAAAANDAINNARNGSGLTRLAQAQAPQAADPAAASPAPTTADEPIGNVATLTGTVTVIRSKNSLPLKLRDDIYFDDTVQTSSSSTLGITFNDSTTFNLSANSRITIDNYIYEEGGSQNAAAFDITKGTVAFVAAAVAKTGNMTITTPTASLGIRGTTGLVEVPEGATAAGANNVAIKLYPDADGKVGRIEVNDRAGARLGALTQGASGFTIRPGGGGARFAAVPLAISPQQAQRDQGFVRQVHAAQSVGRQIVTEQRAFRRANPGLNNRGNQPGNQPNQQRPNGAPGPNRPGQPQQQPGAPNRQAPQQPARPGQTGQPPRPNQAPPTQAPPRQTPQQNQPGTPPQPGAPNRQGTHEQPGAPQQGAPQQQRPGVQRPQVPGRPALQRPRPGAPPKGQENKGKQEKKRY
jgi:hypothetical protein